MLDISRKVSILRLLVATSLTCYLLWLFSRLALWGYFSDDIAKVLRLDGFDSIIPNYEYGFVLWLGLAIASYTGIWLVRSWGFRLLLFTYVLSIASAPLTGVLINTPLERMFLFAYILADGSLLALGYLGWPDLHSQKGQSE